MEKSLSLFLIERMGGDRETRMSGQRKRDQSLSYKTNSYFVLLNR